jgi:hypothetical protein
MNDALGMRGIQRVGNLDAERQQRFQVQRIPVDAVAQGLAFQQLHHQGGLSVGGAHVVDGANVGMAER